MNIETLLDTVKSYNGSADLELIRKAYDFATRLHDGQMRASGEPFVIHPFEVATILANLQMDTTSIAAGLLHDTIEDTVASYEEIEKQFGKEIAMLVDGVTKLTAISASKEQSKQGPVFKSKAESQAENLRKIFLAMAKDIRVILIKLADRLHNLRTLSSLAPEKRKYIAKETLEIFAPITSRLGMWRIKWELEDLAFSHLEPEKFVELEQKVTARRADREKVIHEAIAIIERKLAEHGLKAHIEGRPKHLYSIYQKLTKKVRDFSEIYDLFAVRIIVNTVEECYTVLGTVHSLWIPMKDRIKDYIAVPKSNSYRSLHTTVYGPGDEPLEIQIRTWEMHRINEFGLAAHWAYKENKNEKLAKEIYPWIRRIVDWQLDSKDAREYIENLKLDLLESEVFVFTPRGDVVDLPAGSTPIDFAYRIHTEVGHKCVGAKVNAKIVPLEYSLQNADILEIITSKHATPSLDWLKICRSNHAKNKIRQWFKKERREENIIRGKEIIEKELKRQRIENVLSNTELMEHVTAKLNFVTLDDLYASLGYGETSLPQVLSKIRDEMPKPVEDVLISKRAPSKKEKMSQGIKVKGIDNVLVRFSKCCSPVPGDDIIGYITLGKGISIHRRNCPNMPSLTLQTERVVEVGWDEKRKDIKYNVELEIEAWDRDGLLAAVMNAVNEAKVPALACNAKVKKSKAHIGLCIEVGDKVQLNDIIKRLSHLKGIIAVGRASSQEDYL
ncbi:MAG: bifunctional (p)ppGpp synthetase/guanosine-3',5'-bis(diphosphate) 3'-pyrophosphohydrolase [Candidatus Eremiobacteraeota bacterium]|nr:bifunctional (p)ppGpp synthetase/guanosine-3',5'-bis(diphosphate) 3'-pyrophosphohydrolase [Candidatus Eremiobacteraeota bacterium]